MIAKWIPSFMALLLSVVTIAGPQIQVWMSAHPVAMTVMGTVSLILAHLLPSPVKPPTPVTVETKGPVVVTQPSPDQEPPPVN